MSEIPDNFLSEEDLAWERTYFSLMMELKRRNSSRYAELAARLSVGGEEILELSTGTYKISVHNNGCGYSCQY
jgi:hypothetical protein